MAMKENENVADMLFNSDNSVEKNDLPYPKKPVGVGGFLKFFAIFVCIISPILAGMSILGEFSGVEIDYPDIVNLSGWGDIKTVSYSAWIIQFCVFLYIVNIVYSGEKKSTKWKVIGLMWLAGPLVAIVSMVTLIVVAPDVLRSTMFSEGVGGFFASILWVIVWTLYFLLSKRVANTYRVK